MDITLWNRLRCKTCARARSYLDGRDVRWVNADLEPRDENDAIIPPSAAMLSEWSRVQQVAASYGLVPDVPILVASGSVVQGFDENAYNRVLGLPWSPVLHAREALAALDAGALFVVSHSGGKDSQAMLLRVRQVIPADRIVVVHVLMHEMEWPGTLEHARYAAQAAGIAPDRFFTVQVEQSLLEMVYKRREERADVPSWPSAAYRTCTSDLKRKPIRDFMDWIYANERWPMLIDVEGLRADESSDRAGQVAWEPHDLNGKRSKRTGLTRNWWRWLPIKHLDTAQVFETIAQAGQVPHWAYAAGNERLSCMFCILGRISDLRNAAIHNPELYARYVEAEKRTGWTMSTRKVKGQVVQQPLEERIGLTVEQAWDQHRLLYGPRAMQPSQSAEPQPARRRLGILGR